MSSSLDLVGRILYPLGYLTYAPSASRPCLLSAMVATHAYAQPLQAFFLT